MLRRGDKLERRLERDRPEPLDEFVAALAKRVGSEPAPSRAGWRTAAVVAFTALLVLAFALTGGVGYAARSFQGGTSAVASLVTGDGKSTISASSDEDEDEDGEDDGDDESPADDEYDDDDLICDDEDDEDDGDDEERTLRVSSNALPVHLAQGDTLGPCPDDDEDD